MLRLGCLELRRLVQRLPSPSRDSYTIVSLFQTLCNVLDTCTPVWCAQVPCWCGAKVSHALRDQGSPLALQPVKLFPEGR